MKSLYGVWIAAFIFFSAGWQNAFSQASQQSVEQVIRQKDSLFWQAYNNCDVPGMMQYFTEDLEFYHDKGGITKEKAKFTTSLQTGLCGKAGYRLRREAVPGTVQVFPMHSNGKLYGALISGEHLFYITDNGKPEYLDGHARFTQLWVMDKGVWKMSRILSFDYKPAAHQSK